MPRTTGRLVKATSHDTAPVSPMTSQNRPVTIAGAKIAPPLIVAGCATAIVAMAFMGCTGMGVRK